MSATTVTLTNHATRSSDTLASSSSTVYDQAAMYGTAPNTTKGKSSKWSFGSGFADPFAHQAEDLPKTSSVSAEKKKPLITAEQFMRIYGIGGGVQMDGSNINNLVIPSAAKEEAAKPTTTTAAQKQAVLGKLHESYGVTGGGWVIPDFERHNKDAKESSKKHTTNGRFRFFSNKAA